MNKSTKIIVCIMLLSILSYIVIMSLKPTEILNEEKNESGDFESGEIVSGDEMQYTIEKLSETEIGLIASSDNTEIITKYVFENDAVAEVYVIQEVFSGDFVEDMYEAMKTDEDISKIYEDIILEENVITMKLKQDYVNIYSGVTYEKLYEELEKSLNLSE